MAFNQRVLELGEDPAVPPLERARFLAIFASNLDEFYMVRVAGLKRRIAAGIAVRAASGWTNPYLAFAAMLAAGLKGIEQGYNLPREAEDDVWALTDGERHALGLEPLPHNLDQAIREMENSELVAETLGEHVFDFFLRNKRAEWSDYRGQVSQFELDRLLAVL